MDEILEQLGEEELQFRRLDCRRPRKLAYPTAVRDIGKRLSISLRRHASEDDDVGELAEPRRGSPRRVAVRDLPLELRVDDRDVIAELEKYPEGPERDEFALEALKIGVLALRRASTALDGEFIQRETTRLLDTLRQQLDDHARAGHERLNKSLKEYFDPRAAASASGCSASRPTTATWPRLLTRAARRRRLAARPRRCCRTSGENSPLMKWLSPDQSQGLLALLADERRDAASSQQRERLLKEFSLDNADGAAVPTGEGAHRQARRPVEGPAGQDRRRREGVLARRGELRAQPAGAKRRTRPARRSPASSRSTTNSPACGGSRLELTTILRSPRQDERRVPRRSEDRRWQAGDAPRGRGSARRVTAARSRTRCSRSSSSTPSAAATWPRTPATRTGLIKNCKVGDAVIHLGPDCAAAGARIVIEAKEEVRVLASRRRRKKSKRPARTATPSRACSCSRSERRRRWSRSSATAPTCSSSGTPRIRRPTLFSRPALEIGRAPVPSLPAGRSAAADRLRPHRPGDSRHRESACRISTRFATPPRRFQVQREDSRTRANRSRSARQTDRRARDAMSGVKQALGARRGNRDADSL